MKIARIAVGSVALVLAAPLIADGTENARAVFSMICSREGLALGHRDEALRKYVDDCVSAKLKVYTDDMLNPATAHLPKSC